MNRTFYHGTVDTFVPAILKNGLKPQPNKEWKVEIYTVMGIFAPNDNDRKPAIYCSPNKVQARRYAINKASYYHVKPNSAFPWKSPGKGWGKVTAKKGNDPLYLPDCKPVILKIAVPSAIVEQFELDDKADDAYLCACTIPARYITVIL